MCFDSKLIKIIFGLVQGGVSEDSTLNPHRPLSKILLENKICNQMFNGLRVNLICPVFALSYFWAQSHKYLSYKAE